MCIYIHTHTDIDTYTNIDTYIHTYRHDGVGMYGCMCIYLYMYLYLCVCICIYTYIHTYRHDGVGLGRLEAAEHVLVPHNVAVGDDGHAHVLLDLADDPPVGRRGRRALVWV